MEKNPPQKVPNLGGSSFLEERENNKNDEISVLFQSLPPHLVLEHVIPKLPIKSLLRFKSVCKNWYSLISTPQFAKSHLQSSSSGHNFLIQAAPNLFFLLPYDEHSVNALVKLDCQLLHPMNTSLLGCCNGLVCLYLGSHYHGFFALWNPATRQYRKLSNPNHNIRIPNPTSDLGIAFYGFGYVSLVDDYKIVATFFSDGYDEKGTYLYVFSLKADEWKVIDRLDDAFVGAMDGLVEGLLVDETIYWSFIGRAEEFCIFGFDLVTEQFKVVPNLSCVSWHCIYMQVIKGCLAVNCYGDDQASEVWILNNNGDLGSWEKLFVIPPSPSMTHFHYSVTSKCLIEHSGQLRLVDLDQEAPGYNTDIFVPVLRTRHYVESLVSPFGSAKSANSSMCFD